MQNNGRFLAFEGKPGLVTRLLVAFGAMALSALALVLGVFFFLAFLAIGLVVAVVIWFRLRPIRQQMREAMDAPRPPGDGSVIEGDFTVVRDGNDKDESR